MDYLEFAPTEIVISQEQDALDIVGKLYGKDRLLLLHQGNLDPKFFDLSTKLAGDVLQKFAQYQVKTAFVIDYKSIKSEVFKDLIYEASGLDEYRFFENKQDAVAWLVE
jgi:hypothetical protein